MGKLRTEGTLLRCLRLILSISAVKKCRKSKSKRPGRKTAWDVCFLSSIGRFPILREKLWKTSYASIGSSFLRSTRYPAPRKRNMTSHVNGSVMHVPRKPR